MDIRLYTDGASRGNPGLASYAVIIVESNENLPEPKISKRGEAFEFKTNNQMELLAVVKAFQFIPKLRSDNNLPEDYEVNIYSDSAYVCNMFNKKWIYSWESKNRIEWHPNSDLLWLALGNSRKAGKFKLNWVKGHSDNKFNIIADKYCNELLDKYEV